jgi:hypothetical protein
MTRNEIRYTAGMYTWVVVLAVTTIGCTQTDTIFGTRRIKTFAPEPAAQPPALVQSAHPNGSSENATGEPTDDPKVQHASQVVSDMIGRLQTHSQVSQTNISAGSPGYTPYEPDPSTIAAKLRSRSLAGDEPPLSHSPAARTDTQPAPEPHGQATVEIRPPAAQDPQVPKNTFNEPINVAPVSVPDGPEVAITAVRSKQAHETPSAESAPALPPASQPSQNNSTNAYQANQKVELSVDAADEQKNAELSALINRLKEKIQVRPDDRSAQMKLSVLYAVLGWEQTLAGKDKLPNKSTTDALAKNVARLIEIFDNTSLSPAQQANQALGPVCELQDLLKKEADLKIADLQICRAVDGFSDYKPMPQNYFQAGKRRPIIVYIELENFTSKYLDKEQTYKTSLALTVELIDKSGKVQFNWHDEPVDDFSRRKRRDFFVPPQLNLPPLAAGDYLLKVTAEDLIGNKVTQKTLDLKIESGK